MRTLEAKKYRDKLVLDLKLALALRDMLTDLMTDLYFTSMMMINVLNYTFCLVYTFINPSLLSLCRLLAAL